MNHTKTVCILLALAFAAPFAGADYAASNVEPLPALVDDELTLTYERHTTTSPYGACGDVIAYVDGPAAGTGDRVSLGGESYTHSASGATTMTVTWQYTPTVPGVHVVDFDDTPGGCANAFEMDETLQFTAYMQSGDSVDGTGGGSVSNVQPTMASTFTGDQGTFDNVAAVTETFTAIVYDANRESDLEEVSITSGAGWSTTLATLVAGTYTDAAGEWTVTDDTPDDGFLEVAFAYEWPEGQTPGTYTQTFCVKDEAAPVCDDDVDQTMVEDAPIVLIDAGLYDEDANPVGGNWGQWITQPGATDVDTLTFIKITNDGTAAQDFNVAYTNAVWLGAVEGDTMDIPTNLGFQTGDLATPADGMTDHPVDADGMATYTVQAGETLWLGYYIAAIPEPFSDDTYTAPYTVTLL